MDICFKCNKAIFSDPNSFTTGYGIDERDNKICYACCAIDDKERMKRDGKITLYMLIYQGLSDMGIREPETRCKVTNWPGTLVFDNLKVKIGRHNIAGKRYDTWFIFDNYVWHGYTIGDNTQICHCKRTKEVFNRQLIGVS